MIVDLVDVCVFDVISLFVSRVDPGIEFVRFAVHVAGELM